MAKKRQSDDLETPGDAWIDANPRSPEQYQTIFYDPRTGKRVTMRNAEPKEENAAKN